jgi:hypothetical protein
MITEALLNLETRNGSIFLGIFISNFIWTLSSKPLLRPLLKIQVTIWMGSIVSLLKFADKIMESRIGPFVLFEIQL